LTVLSIQEIAVIGARAALRALPLMSFGSPAEPTFSAALLSMLRLTSLAWAAAAYPARTPNLAALNAARIDAINTGVGLVRAIAAAGAGYSTNQVEEILQEVVLGIRALRTASAQSDGDASAAAFDLALSQDLNDLRGVRKGSASLAKLELWPGGGSPEWMARRWEGLRRDLIDAGLGWEVWVQWYQDRLWLLELADMGIALVHDERELADPLVGLAQFDAEPIDELLAPPFFLLVALCGPFCAIRVH
jgi:hypothetical protein